MRCNEMRCDESIFPLKSIITNTNYRSFASFGWSPPHPLVWPLRMVWVGHQLSPSRCAGRARATPSILRVVVVVVVVTMRTGTSRASNPNNRTRTRTIAREQIDDYHATPRQAPGGLFRTVFETHAQAGIVRYGERVGAKKKAMVRNYNPMVHPNCNSST
mmetsp:Transcript_2106/g.3943  ORF Transcript_2106/g.3943 Transcript_2106/m.3943 type:complete len:160 (-) Transcript_2106:98-577(-)